jgi:hypothetical protein
MDSVMKKSVVAWHTENTMPQILKTAGNSSGYILTATECTKLKLPMVYQKCCTSYQMAFF